VTTQIVNPLRFDLTEAALFALGERPIIAGDNWEMRFQVIDEDGNPVNLGGAKIVMTWRIIAESQEILFERSSGLMTTGVSQIEADVDQSVVTDDGNEGTGWYAVRCLPGDEATIIAAIGARAMITARYDVRINLPDGTMGEHLAGLGDLKRPITLAGEF
jgi:hypothetical protein